MTTAKLAAVLEVPCQRLGIRLEKAEALPALAEARNNLLASGISSRATR